MPFGETESGLLTNYNGRVTRAEFAPDAASQNPTQTFLWLTFQTDNPDNPEYTERFSCGDGWVSYDGGRTVQHPDGKKGFHPNANAGRFVDAVGNITPAAILDKRGHHTHADSYIGLAYHMAEQKGSFTRRDTGEKVEFVRNVPDKFLGENWQAQLPLQQPSPPTTLTSTAPTTQASPVGNAPSSTPSSVNIDNGTRNALREVARNSEDVAQFTRNVLTVEAVTHSPDLMMALTGPDSARYYDELRAEE